MRADGDGNAAARDTIATSSRSVGTGRPTPSQAVPSSAGEVETRVRTMSRDDLVVLWQRRWRRAPPKGLSRRLLEFSAAWLLQADASGGLTAAARRRLDALARTKGRNGKATGRGEPAGNNGRPPVRRTLCPGSRLVRQWQGRCHVVMVTEGGFTYEGRSYTSLTAIAREITGAGWSGPRFFGLKAPAPDKTATRNRRKQHSDGKGHPAAAMREGESDG